jgi:hypothetical protein
MRQLDCVVLDWLEREIERRKGNVLDYLFLSDRRRRGGGDHGGRGWQFFL